MKKTKRICKIVQKTQNTKYHTGKILSMLGVFRNLALIRGFDYTIVDYDEE
ncbi:hypothetical protein TREAZ_1156 [Leadbettera azotonutricia ZAS-9]|uniref:Uncharacterized protein n=1 Tax=Leadbettera azotonutricia (strain ATCC BAA-888 / DSM 13862 / ZAS-9) TaxID=545695 RepID=F5Y740_LEAAZ|nr:hypothetical protein TREAZ_1156 [Leadbettera azotonutricia ZAS-9]